jgi:hypothetical protein
MPDHSADWCEGLTGDLTSFQQLSDSVAEEVSITRSYSPSQLNLRHALSPDSEMPLDIPGDPRYLDLLDALSDTTGAIRRVGHRRAQGRPRWQLPSGKHAVNAAWLAHAMIAFNLARAAGVAASTTHPRARCATLRTRLIAVPAQSRPRPSDSPCACHGNGPGNTPGSPWSPSPPGRRQPLPPDHPARAGRPMTTTGKAGQAGGSRVPGFDDPTRAPETTRNANPESSRIRAQRRRAEVLGPRADSILDVGRHRNRLEKEVTCRSSMAGWRGRRQQGST